MDRGKVFFNDDRFLLRILFCLSHVTNLFFVFRFIAGNFPRTNICKTTKSIHP